MCFLKNSEITGTVQILIKTLLENQAYAVSWNIVAGPNWSELADHLAIANTIDTMDVGAHFQSMPQFVYSVNNTGGCH